MNEKIIGDKIYKFVYMLKKKSENDNLQSMSHLDKIKESVTLLC